MQRKIWEVDIINYLKNPCKKKLINPIARICNPSQVALDLAWGGLKDAPVFNDANIPLTSEDRARIIARYNCESLGFTVNSGTPNEQNPLGETCN